MKIEKIKPDFNVKIMLSSQEARAIDKQLTSCDFDIESKELHNLWTGLKTLLNLWEI